MRLICGMLRLDGESASDRHLDAMAAGLTAPGTNPGLSRHIDGPLGMAVLDFTGGTDGLVRREGLVLALDTRLDRGLTDEGAAVIGAIRQHGADFPDHLHGDFAVAAWDAARGELILGRDYIGVRPLVWTLQPGRCLAFASLPAGLIAASPERAAPDPVALGLLLVHGYFVGADTGHAGIAMLQAGHSLTVRPGEGRPPRLHRAYRPDPRLVGRWRGDRHEAAARLRDLVTEAVNDRLPPQGVVASHLTGGLDSSAVTVLAARGMRERGGRILALSKLMPTAMGPAELDERPLIAAVLAQEPDIVHAGAPDLLPLPSQPQHPDWPGLPLDGPEDDMAAAAAAFGADRILSGVGGDEGASYHGANLYARLLRDGWLRTLARELPARARRDGVSLKQAVRGRLIGPLLPDGLARRLGVSVGRGQLYGSSKGVARFLAPGLRDAVEARRMRKVLVSNDPEERVAAFADHHIPSRCSFYAITAARRGLAASFPLLDRRVVDFVLSLPAGLFLDDGFARQPFRAAMDGILPDVVRLKAHKVGLYDDRFIRYADHRAALLAEVDRLAARRSEIVCRLFDLTEIRAALALLPDAANALDFVRARPGDLHGGVPPWLPLIAVHCLIVARHLDDHAAVKGGEDGITPARNPS